MKYVVHDGEVRSKDGNVHFISCEQLFRLYGVEAHECIFDSRSNPNTFRGYSEEYLNSLTHLYPRSDGNYKLEEK